MSNAEGYIRVRPRPWGLKPLNAGLEGLLHPLNLLTARSLLIIAHCPLPFSL
jgi:hypothetical protein